MKKIINKGDRFEPKLEINENKIFISGKSVIEGYKNIFNDVLKCFDDILYNNIEIIIDLEYFNTSTVKNLTTFIKYINKFNKENKKEIKIIWYYDKNDYDALETGECLREFCECDFDLFEKG